MRTQARRRNLETPLWRGHLRPASTALILVAVLFSAATAARPQEAETAKPPSYSVLYAFTGGADGSDYNTLAPYDKGLIQDHEGNLYGTAFAGGDVTGGEFSPCSSFGCGVVYKLTPKGKETVLHAFTGSPDGSAPEPGLVHDEKGNLFGVTIFGGSAPMASGTVFKVTTGGNETVLYSFTGGPDGGYPAAALLRGDDGYFYGTTGSGGLPDCFFGGCGVVFKIDAAGKETVLYSFTGGADGGKPFAGLVRDHEGNLYGTASEGGSGNGVVFKLDCSGKETVLHSFSGGDGGSNPETGLVRDDDGNLYGVAGGGHYGQGIVYKLDPKGKFKVLYAFTGGTDGALPQGRLTLVGKNLYGNAYYGGNVEPDCFAGCGVVFKIDPAGNETVLYSFTGGAEGSNPYGRLLHADDGTFYGITGFGGDVPMGPSSPCPNGCGVVFKLQIGERCGEDGF
jgi:uncharacterized repeat protein (TIGR03803 family)